MILAVYNLKGGVGKTTSIVNLAYVSACRGARTLVWDLDPQAASTYYLRTKAKLKKGTKSLLKKKGALAEVRETVFEQLFVIPADFSTRKLDAQLDGGRHFKPALKHLSKSFDVILLDCAPAAGSAIQTLLPLVDGLVVPLIPTVLSLRSYQQMCDKLMADVNQVMPFFNLLDRRKNLHRMISEEARLKDSNFLETIVPSASEIEKMGIEQAPLGSFAPRTRLGDCYEQLWDEVLERLRRT